MRNERALLALVAALLWLYLAAEIATPSMGLDGVIYAAIANLAASTSAGQAGFWYPPHFEAGITSFHDHPPLGLWILTQWFKLFGESFWVERAFNVLMTLSVAAVVVYLWRRACSEVEHDSRDAGVSWWPLAILCLMPVSTYALKNNALEGLTTLATLLGVAAAWTGKDRPLWNIGVGFACLAAVLVKGPVGLFPLAAPACFALFVVGDFRRAVTNSIIAGGTFALAMGLLLNVEAAGSSLQSYFESQLVASFAGERLVEHGRIYQLGQLLLNIATGGVLVALVWAGRRKFQFPNVFWAYFFIGLAASLPLLLSPRQYKHYLLSSLPYFAICMALVVRPNVERWRKDVIWAVAGMVLVLATTRTFWYFGAPGKDLAELKDAQLIAEAVAAFPVDFCAPTLQRRAYLARYHRVRTGWVNSDDARDYYVCSSSFSDPRYTRMLQLSDDLALWRRRQS